MTLRLAGAAHVIGPGLDQVQRRRTRNSSANKPTRYAWIRARCLALASRRPSSTSTADRSYAEWTEAAPDPTTGCGAAAAPTRHHVSAGPSRARRRRASIPAGPRSLPRTINPPSSHNGVNGPCRRAGPMRDSWADPLPGLSEPRADRSAVGLDLPRHPTPTWMASNASSPQRHRSRRCARRQLAERFRRSAPVRSRSGRQRGHGDDRDAIGAVIAVSGRGDHDQLRRRADEICVDFGR